MEVKISFKKISLFKNKECLCPPVPIFAASAMVEDGAFSGLDSACAASSWGTGTLHCTRARRQWYQGSSLDLGSRGLPGRLSEGCGPRAPLSFFFAEQERHVFAYSGLFLSDPEGLESREPVREGWLLLTAQGRWLGLSGQRWEPHPFRL